MLNHKHRSLSLWHPFSPQAVGLPEAQIPHIHSQPHLAGLRALADNGWQCRVEYLTEKQWPYSRGEDKLLWRFWPRSTWPGQQKTAAYRCERSWMAVAGLWASPPDVLILNISGLGSSLTYALARACRQRGSRYIAMIGGIHVGTDAKTLSYLQSASSIIVHTNEQQRMLSQRADLAGCTIHVLPLGVDETLFSVAPDRVPLGSPALLFVGRWQPWKGLHRALEALDVVRRRYPQARLHIIGPESDAVYARQIRLRIQDLNLADSVIIHGPIPYADLPRWYQSADLLILPSDPGKESFGMVVAESMACGTPVVALSAAQGGPAEMITHAVDGLLVEEAEMGAAIVELCGQPDHLLAMREAARQKVLGHFTRKVTAQILQDIVCST